MSRQSWGELAAAMVVAAAFAGSAAVPAAAQEKLSVRLDFAPWGVQAAMHLANQQGLFKAAGLEVDVQDGRGSGNTIQLVNAGQVDVGQVQVGLLGAARTQGAALKAIATIMPKTDLCVLVDKASPMTKAADLKGKTTVVFAASPWAPLIDPYLKAGGLNRETATIDFVDPAALWGTYIAKRADGLMSTASSAVPVAEASRPSKCLWASDAGLNFMSYGLVVKEDTLAKRGPVLKKLIETQQRAWEQIRKNPEDGVKAMLAARPDARLDPTVQRSQIVMSLDFFETPATKGKPIGWQATADWEATLKTLEAAGVVKPGWKADDYFTNALMD